MYSDTMNDYLISASLDQRERDLAQLHRAREAQTARPERQQREQRRRRLADHPLVTALLRWLAGPIPPYSSEF